MLSRNNVFLEEWMLHRVTVQKIWEIFGKARVDLFASKDNSHCPIFFAGSTDALAHKWPYAFFPIALLPQVLRRVRERRTSFFNSPPLEEPTVGCQNYSSCWWQPRGQSLWDRTSFLSERHDYGIHGPSYGPCSVAARRELFSLPERVLKHNGRS